jgi:hypothetical protein
VPRGHHREIGSLTLFTSESSLASPRAYDPNRRASLGCREATHKISESGRRRKIGHGHGHVYGGPEFSDRP